MITVAGGRGAGVGASESLASGTSTLGSAPVSRGLGVGVMARGTTGAVTAVLGAGLGIAAALSVAVALGLGPGNAAAFCVAVTVGVASCAVVAPPTFGPRCTSCGIAMATAATASPS